ncbi:MAG: hypothetical protein ACREQA_19790 [Candidatus Binatia bacterium]
MATGKLKGKTNGDGSLEFMNNSGTSVLKIQTTQGATSANLTDNTGGTASDTLADVPAAYTEATLANQLASLAAKINNIQTVLRNAKMIP